MRGRQDSQVTLLAFVDLETRVPSDHPIRVVKRLADQALKALSPDLDRMYANVGRPSIPPERLPKSSLLIALYSVRSERAFCEQLDYNLLFRWFLDMNLIEPSFDATTFTKNRERLLRHGVGQALFGEVVLEADRQGLLSDEHFTVDGTLIEAAASLKSFKPRGGDPPRTTDADPGNPSVDFSVDFHGERRSNATHQSTTDAEARLLRKGKGKEARLVFMAHALMENRHGMLVDFQTTQATCRCSAINVRLSVRQKCHSVGLRWYQMARLWMRSGIAASAGFPHQCIFSPCLCEFPTPSPSFEWTIPGAWPAAPPSISPSAGMSASSVMWLPATL